MDFHAPFSVLMAHLLDQRISYVLLNNYYLQIQYLTPPWLEHAPLPVAVLVVPSLQTAPDLPFGQSPDVDLDSVGESSSLHVESEILRMRNKRISIFLFILFLVLPAIF